MRFLNLPTTTARNALRTIVVSATYSVQVGDEVYVYVRGRLVMKRWLKTGVSMTFYG